MAHIHCRHCGAPLSLPKGGGRWKGPACKAKFGSPFARLRRPGGLRLRGLAVRVELAAAAMGLLSAGLLIPWHALVLAPLGRAYPISRALAVPPPPMTDPDSPPPRPPPQPVAF